MIVTFFHDFFDRRAQTHSGQTVADFLKVALPGVLGGIAPIVGPLSDLLDRVPGVGRVVRVAVPLVLVYVCAIVVRATRRSSQQPGFGLVETKPVLEYAFPQASRNAAKVGFPLLLLLTFFEAWDGAPNWLVRRATLSGYVCRADGLPVDRSATVVALNRADEPVSEEAASVDDNGYVVMMYRPWGTRAAKIQIVDGLCGKAVIAAQTPARGDGCRRDSLRPPDRGERAVWILPCAK